MYWIAFTLGFFGSLHCIGMCGPLAIGLLNMKDNNGLKVIFHALTYNLGRTFSYVILGSLVGLIGTAFAFIGMQKMISISLGIGMIGLYLFSFNRENIFNKIPVIQHFNNFIHKNITHFLMKGKSIPAFGLGMINGLIPCGLVYLAIAGSLSLGSMYERVGFMFYFGLGTFPAMIFITVGYQKIGNSLRFTFQKLYPILTLFMGFYLIYRGIMTDLPMDLDFFEAIKHPIMCH